MRARIPCAFNDRTMRSLVSVNTSRCSWVVVADTRTRNTPDRVTVSGATTAAVSVSSTAVAVAVAVGASSVAVDAEVDARLTTAAEAAADGNAGPTLEVVASDPEASNHRRRSSDGVSMPPTPSSNTGDVVLGRTTPAAPSTSLPRSCGAASTTRLLLLVGPPSDRMAVADGCNAGGDSKLG